MHAFFCIVFKVKFLPVIHLVQCCTEWQIFWMPASVQFMLTCQAWKMQRASFWFHILAKGARTGAMSPFSVFTPIFTNISLSKMHILPLPASVVRSTPSWPQPDSLMFLCSLCLWNNRRKAHCWVTSLVLICIYPLKTQILFRVCLSLF